MKIFKIADFWISAFLIPAFVIFGFITMNDKFITGYFIVGGWQILSMIIHFAAKWFTQKSNLRPYYHKFVFWFVAIISLLIGIGRFIEITWLPILIAAYILLFTTPFMAVFYTYLCYEETFIKMKRPMELLK